MDVRLLNILENIPNAVGVYLLYDKLDRIIYIGKSKHIRTRLLQHFKSTAYREIRIQQEVVRIEYEIMGDETISLLHESELVKIHQPKYNRALRKTKYSFGLYDYIDANGYISLIIERLDPSKFELMTFIGLQEAKDRLFNITERYELCQKINGLYKTKGACFQYQLKACYGACINKESVELYNSRVEHFKASVELPAGHHFLEVSGRTADEKGIIYLKEGIYKGFGYCNKRVRSEKTYLKAINFKADNRDTRRIIKRYLTNLSKDI